MRVALVVPGVSRHIHRETFEPLGILYIAAQIFSRHDIQIVDAFNRRLSLQETLGEINEFNPDVVGISLTMSPTAPFARNLASSLKKANPGIIIIAGGTHATFLAEELTMNTCIDVVVLHEGEIAFTEILECLERGTDLSTVKGIQFQSGGKSVRTQKRAPLRELDLLSLPARHLLPDHTIYSRKHILSSRGCVFKCIYCASSAMNQYRWRHRSAANVISEIESVVSHYSTSFYFADDNFPVNRQRVDDICRGIIGNGINSKWSCLARLEFINDARLLEIMARSGCKEIFIGVESGSNRILKKMDRKYTAEDVKQTIRLCSEMGISTTASFIIGSPLERVEDIRRTFKLCMDLNTHNVAFHIFTPYVGTPAHSFPRKFGITILSDNTEEYDKNLGPVITTRYLSADQIMELYCESFGISLKKARQRQW